MASKISAKCIIRVYTKCGHLKTERVIDNDLILANLIEYWKILGEATPSMTDINNNGRTFSFERKVTWEDIGGENFLNCEGWHGLVSDLKIAVGTGTSGPTRGDYQLGSKVMETTEVNENWASGELTWSASLTATTSYTITEAGFLANIWYNSGISSTTYCENSTVRTGTNYAWFLMIRDTFSAIPVASGETISIAFKLDFQ